MPILARCVGTYEQCTCCYALLGFHSADAMLWYDMVMRNVSVGVLTYRVCLRGTFQEHRPNNQTYENISSTNVYLIYYISLDVLTLDSFKWNQESNGLRGIVSSEHAGSSKRTKRFGDVYVL